MMTLDDTLNVVMVVKNNPFPESIDYDALIDEAKRIPEVLTLYVVGSAAVGQRTPVSDFDFAVWVDPKSESVKRRRIQLDLIERFSRVLSDDRVDVVILNDAPGSHQYHLLKSGRILFSTDDALRAGLQSGAVARYLDWLPAQRYLQEALINRIKAGRFGRGEP